MKAFFSMFLYDPIFNAFIALYNAVGDVGIVILVITVLIKLALYPLTSSSIKAQKAITELQPKLEDLKKKYKDDQQTLAQETMKLYRDNKVNPMGSCLPMLVQLPIFIALYYVLRDAFSEAPNFDILYSFVSNPETINPITLGLFNLGEVSIVLAVLAAASQYWQAKMFSSKRAKKVAQVADTAGEGGKDESMAVFMNEKMLLIMPVITLIIGMQFPGGLTLYWFLSTLLTALQQLVVFKSQKNTTDSNVIEGELVK